MIKYIIYGKIIIDDIRLLNGEMRYGVLGGGGAQAAFGARLWDPSVGILTRSGTDIEPAPRKMLEALGIDLQGWQKYDDIPTPHGLMAYDENELMTGLEEFQNKRNIIHIAMEKLLAQVLPIPEAYSNPRVIHLVTEYVDEPMAHEALKMQANGAIYSLEPIIDYINWENRDAMLAYYPNVDIVTPDWPSASGIAGSEDPKEVLKHWSKLGASCVAVRNGSKGSYVWDKETDQMWHIPIAEVQAIDPTGCGNSYGGGLSVGWDKYRDARKAGCCGTISASYMALNIGVPPVTEALETEAQENWEKLYNRVTPL